MAISPIGLINDVSLFISGIEYKPCSFRGIVFYVTTNTTSFGRRFATHESPWSEKGANLEDMGAKTREFQVEGFIVGDDWESRRNELILACETKGEGELIHTDYGRLMVMCSSCSVTESRLERRRVANFSLTFTEQGKQKLEFVMNPILALRNKVKEIYKAVKAAFTTLYMLYRAPAFVKAAVQNVIGTYTDNLRTIPNNNVQKAIRTLDNVDIDDAEAVSEAITGVVRSLGTDVTEQGIYDNGTKLSALYPTSNDYIITPTRCISYCKQIQDIVTPEISGTTESKQIQRVATEAVALLFKASATMEMSLMSTYINYSNYEQAKYQRDLINGYYETTLDAAATAGFTTFYQLLEDQRAYFIKDIEARAPSIQELYTKTVYEPLPLLVTSYEEYADISKVAEIAERNRIRHPGFCSGEVELVFARK